MLVIAHRGSNRKAPENSLQAFRTSIDEGAKRLELDLWLSKDKQIYVCHDDNTARTTSKRIKISQSTEDQLCDVYLENGETLPRLEQVLPYLQKVELNLELKGNNLELADVLAAKIMSVPSREKIILSSFEVPMLERLQAVCPKIKRAFLWEKNSSDYLSVDYDRIKDGIKSANTHIFHPDARYFDKKMSDFARFENLEVYTWAPLREEEMSQNCKLWQNLLDYGVDGHCTNYPLELAAFLRDKKISGARV